jgi:hypothetical protein
MPFPKRYATKEDLVRALRSHAWANWFNEQREQEKSSDLQLIIRHSVGPNIFRAFRHLPEKPSVVFREWASGSFSNQFLMGLRTVTSQSEYREWAYSVSDSLRLCWSRRMGSEMIYGPSLKLTNLIAKRLCLFSEVPTDEVWKLAKFLEVPLDIYTIQAVANCVSTFPNPSAIGRVPTTATMSFIRDQRMYEAFQDGILEITNLADVPPIALDCMVWDATH